MARAPFALPIRAGLAVLLGLTLPLGLGRAQDLPAPTRFERAAELIETLVADSVVPSIGVAVLQDGELVWAGGFGFADREAGTLATADTIYRLASISKPFTATLLAQLEEAGKVDLDAPVAEYLDGHKIVAYAGDERDVTLRALCNHTAGLPTHWTFYYQGLPPPPRTTSIDEYAFTVWPPGTRTNYSNLAFGIVDHVVALRSGRSFRDTLVEELCDPLGMTHTDLGVRAGHEADAAVGYIKDLGGRFVPVADYGFDHDGASAVRSSARDMMRFAQLQIGAGEVDGRRLLGSKSALAMRERHGAGTGSAFGLAWGLAEVRGHQVLQHSGGMPGVATLLQVFPAERSALVVLTNASGHGAVAKVRDAILDALFGPAPDSPRVDPKAREEPVRLPDGRWSGQVLHPDGPLALELSIEDGRSSLLLGNPPLRDEQSVQFDGKTLTIRTRGRLRTMGSVHGPVTLDFRLERGLDRGWYGVLYADCDGVCRLPHYVRLMPRAPDRSEALRVVTYNILVGFDDYGIGDPYLCGAQRRVAATTWLAAQHPDVVALQELNGYTEERLRREARGWGHDYAVMVKENGYPIGLTSNRPIEVVERRVAGLHHGILHCRTHGTDFIAVHVVPSPGVERKLGELGQAAAMFRAAVAAGRDAMVLGDFNCIASTDVDRYSAVAIERYNKWRYALDDDGRPSEDALAPLREADAIDVGAAWLGAGPLPLPRIDFMFASAGLASRCVAGASHWEPPFLTWSDHPAVVADFARRR